MDSPRAKLPAMSRCSGKAVRGDSISSISSSAAALAHGLGVLAVGGQLRRHDLRDEVAVVTGYRDVPRDQQPFLPDGLHTADGGEVVREQDRRGPLG